MNKNLCLWPLRAGGGLSSAKKAASTYNFGSAGLFLPTFGLRVNARLYLWPFQAGGEFRSMLRGDSLSLFRYRANISFRDNK